MALEIVGLGFLFFELLRSKKVSHKEDAIGSFHKSLENDVIGLQINNQKVLADVVRTMQKLSEMKTDVLTDALWRAFSDNLKAACENLPSSEKTNELRIKNTVAAAEVIKSFSEINEENQRLRRIAIIGIAFVLVGAGMQFADMTIL